MYKIIYVIPIFVGLICVDKTKVDWYNIYMYILWSAIGGSGYRNKRDKYFWR